MMSERFGETSLEEIREKVNNSVPKNTIKTKKYIWDQFEDFCRNRNYNLGEKVTVVELARISEDWAYNMRKKDGSQYKEGVIKTMWDNTVQMLQEKYRSFNIFFDPFKDPAFKNARDARNSHRKELQTKSSSRRESAHSLTYDEYKKMINIWDEEKPDELQRKFFHIASVELAWRGGEATKCLVSFFKKELNNDGTGTGRWEYNTVFSKTRQGGDQKLTDSKWLVRNSKNPSMCPVRLFEKMLSLRSKNITTDRLFLTVNKNWQGKGSSFINSPIGRNTMSKWTKEAATKIGLKTQDIKITNHSNRATAVSSLSRAGIGEEALIKITGHGSASSIKPYLQLDQSHHLKIVEGLRGSSKADPDISAQPSTSSTLPQQDINIATTMTSSTLQNQQQQTHNVFNNCVFNNYYSSK